MKMYILKRVLLMIPTLLGVAVLIFFLMRVVPGDIVELRFSGESAAASKETLDIERKRLGLDKPLMYQFVDYMGGLLRGRSRARALQDKTNLPRWSIIRAAA